MRFAPAILAATPCVHPGAPDLEAEMTAREWIARYAAALGVPAPDDADVDSILEIAGVAAHASERTAAPVACWLAP